MPILTHCPSCTRQLRVPENLLGRLVKCPTCQTTFTATGEEEDLPIAPVAGEPQEAPHSAPTPAEVRSEPLPQARRPLPPEDDEDYDYGEEREYEPRPRRPRRRLDLQPHRGSLILTLGILGFFCFGIILGPIAWSMGNNDLREIRAGRMDPEGEGSTNAGRICGIIATCLAAIWCLCGLGYGVMIALLGGVQH